MKLFLLALLAIQQSLVFSEECDEEQLKQMVKRFFDLDTNGNGVLDRGDNLDSALEQSLCCNYYVDGQATFAEYLQRNLDEINVDLTDDTVRGISTRFFFHDLNGDGFVDANDMQTYLENDWNQNTIVMLQGMDTSGDGKVSFCECMHYGPIHEK